MGVLDMFRLDGKVAVLTGASSVLGVAFARGLAEAGADLVLAARPTDKLQKTRRMVERIGHRALVVEADTSRATRIVDASIAEFGKVDILVNNAEPAPGLPVAQETPEQLRSTVNANLFGSYWMAQACGRVMEPGSAIVNIASVIGMTTGELPQAAYSSSKAAVVGLTRDLAQQWTGRKGIRVTAMAPGAFVSQMTDQYSSGYVEEMFKRVQAGRFGNPEELAATVVFLASAAGGCITGSALPVDGRFVVA